LPCGEGTNAPGVIRATEDKEQEQTMQKQNTIAETMRKLMESGPSVETFPTYKSLNDHVGKVHGLTEGKCQALAGEKAWAWTPDQTTGKWRKATDVEVEARRAKAAGKSHGVRGSKVMSDVDRAALDAQIEALEQVANPALAPLLEGLKARQAADDAARKGSLKDRLQAAIDKLGIARAVDLLEALAGAVEAGAAESVEAITAYIMEKTNA
jgi:hypothetical protein